MSFIGAAKEDLEKIRAMPFISVRGVLVANLIELVSCSDDLISQFKKGNEVTLVLAVIKLANKLHEISDALEIIEAGPAVGDA